MMRYGRKRRFTAGRLVAALLAVSALGLLLPTSITGWFMNLVQVLVPLQDAATRAGDAVEATLAGAGEPVSAEEHERVLREVQSLRNALASQSARVVELEAANRVLTGIRSTVLGDRGELIPARVVAGDALAWRDSRLINAGTLRGVRRGASVTTRALALDVGADDRVDRGLAVLAEEALIGLIEEAATHTARVRLLSDPATRKPVTISGFEEHAEFWLEGRGQGRMEVVDVDHRYVNSEDGIRIGDVVLTLADDPELPVPLVVGEVTQVEADADNGLLYILTVESVAPERLRHVHVLRMPHNPR